MTIPASLALSISSQLIQDYLYVNEPPPPALAERGSLVAIEGGLLAIDGDQVVQFELEPASEGGWKHTPIDVPVPPTAASSNIMSIKAFIIEGNKNYDQPASTLNLLCFFPAAGWAEGGGKEAAYSVSWLVRETGGAWQNALLSTEVVGLLSQVQSVDVFDAGAGKGKFVYGVTTDLLGRQNSQMFVLKIWNYNLITTVPWQIASQQPAPETTGGQMRFLASGDPDHPRSVSLCFASTSNSNTVFTWTPPLAVDEGAGPDISGRLDLGFVTLPGAIREFLPLNGLSDWTALAVGEDGIVSRLVFPTDTSQSCSITALNQAAANVPTNITSVSVTRRVGDTLSLFAVAGQQLWLTRDINNVSWVQLGNAVTQLATPKHDPTVFEVFYADPTGTQANRIYHFSQDTAKSVWKRQALATFKDPTFTPGAAGPTEVGTISVELSATDPATRQPVQNALINVSSDQWVVLLADKLSYWVGPGTDQQIPTDQLGLATMRYHAADLTFPHLTFYATAQGMPNSPAVGCRGDVVDGNASPSTSTAANRLAGNDSGFTMNTAALQQKNLLPGSSEDDKTTDCIKQLGTMMVKQNAKDNGAASSDPTPSVKTTWAFSRSASGYRCDVSTAPALDSDVEGFFDDAGDVLNFLKHTVEHVGDFAVSYNPADYFATIAIGAYKFTVSTARQTGDAIGTIFAHVMAGLRELEDVLHDLIEFLKMLFDWSDILDTHNALKTLLNWGINFVPANLDAVNGWVDRHVSGIGDKINAAMSKAETYLQQNDLTLNSYAQRNNLKTPDQSQPDLHGSVYQMHLSNHKSRCTYPLSKSRTHVSAVTQQSGSGASVTGVMNANFAKPSITGQKTTLLPSLQNLLLPNGAADVAAVFDASALALLQLSKDLTADVVAGLETVIKAVLEALTTAAEWFTSALTEPLDIPVISWLYSSLVEETLFPSNNDLSPLDLFCLILAVPVTVLYKLVRNGEAPFGGPRAAAMQAAFKDPANTDFAALSGFGADSMLGASGGDLSVAAEVLGVVAGCLTCYAGIVGILADFVALMNNLTGTNEPTPATIVISWASWALSTLTVLCEAPITVFSGFSQGADSSGIIETILFGLETLSSAGDFLSLVSSKTSIMEMYPDTGAYYDGAFGIAIMGAATIYVLDGLSNDTGGPWDYLNAVLSNLNRPFRMIIPWVAGGDLVAFGILGSVVAITDIAATVGGTVTQIGSSLRG